MVFEILYKLLEIPFMAYENGTDIPELGQENLEPYQIFLLFWNVLNFIPTVALLNLVTMPNVEIIKYNFYFIIRHWCISCMLQTVASFYYSVIPDAAMSSVTVRLIESISWSASMLVMITGLSLIFDKMMNCTNTAYSFVRNNWIGTAVGIFFSILTVILGFVNLVVSLYINFGVSSVIVLIFIIRNIVFCYKGSEAYNFKLRSFLAFVTIVSNYIYFAFLFSNEFVLLENSSFMIIYVISRVITSANPILFIIILVCCDSDSRARFVSKFICCRNRASRINSTEIIDNTTNESDA